MLTSRKSLLIAAGLVLYSQCSLAVQAVSGEETGVEAPTVNTSEELAIPALPADGEQVVIPDATPPLESPVASAKPAPAVAPLMDLTSAPPSLWQRIRNGFGLPDMASPLVREQEEWFAKRPEYMARTVERSSRYLYHIVDRIEKRGMPSEIALLPIIESAYNPVAYSRAHASGIWQFIPSTGKLYGLQQNFWYDGRRDVMAATDAALDYLEKLYDMFGSWDLALAAYNWGEGAVSRAIAKNVAKGQPIDYRSLHMPAETRYYMPKLQAVKNIIANPAQYGIELAEVPNRPYFVAITTTKHMDVKLAAKLADMDVQEFVSLNPGNSRAVIKADSERSLLLPADKAGTFLSNLETHNEPLLTWQAYKLKSGETVDRVAARYGIDVGQLKHVNSIKGAQRVGAGATLLVPRQGNSAPYLPDMPATHEKIAKAKKSAKHAHAARKGRPVKVADSRGTTRRVAAAGPKKSGTASAKSMVADHSD